MTYFKALSQNGWKDWRKTEISYYMFPAQQQALGQASLLTWEVRS
jgi:hypothetical protein